MASRIYSELIYSRPNFGVTDTITLDNAYVWVVRDIEVYFYAAANPGGVYFREAHNGCVFWSCVRPSVPDGGLSVQWEGRQVFVPLAGEPTIEIEPITPSTQIDCRIMAYRLTPP